MMIVVLNLTPVSREDYQIGAPRAGRYAYRLSSDHDAYGGSAYPIHDAPETDAFAMHGFAQSLRLTLPPLAAVVLEPAC
jgi:1,4-alpha-glucan branching enzyme